MPIPGLEAPSAGDDGEIEEPVHHQVAKNEKRRL